MRLRKRLIGFILVIQCILFLTHFLLYKTWTFSPAGPDLDPGLGEKLVFGLLSVSFVVTSLLAFRYTDALVRAFYRVAAVWLGLVSFLVFAALFCWIILAVTHLAGVPLDFHLTVEILFGIAILAGLCGVLNANRTRITRVRVQIANLPAAWRGRRAALISDLHLGHVRNGGFLRRMVSMIMREKPEIVFIPGDLYDGTAIDTQSAAEPLKRLKAPYGVYFVAGNHEQFGDDTQYLQAVERSGVRVLRNEKVEVEGLQIVGVPFRNAVSDRGLAALLGVMHLDRSRASIFLTHAPDRPHVAEAAGFSLQLSGHTHLGQFIPWSWIVWRMYGQFAYGLSRIGNMQVFTSSGAGTWGPPLRLGSNPEIVILEFA
jgi:predicted MPP superfamily phosphohydrolase